MSQMQQGQNWFEICLVSPGKMPDLERLPNWTAVVGYEKKKKKKTKTPQKTKQNKTKTKTKKKTKNKNKNKNKTKQKQKQNKTKQSKAKQNPQCGNTSEENLMHCIWIK